MVYVFLATGFEEMEALAPTDILRRAKVDVKTVGVTGSVVSSSHGVTVSPDLFIDDIKLDENLDMIVLPGGMPGTLNLEGNDKVQKVIDYCSENDKFIAAICAAPSILGHKGLLKGKKATCFPGFEKDLDGAELVDSLVAADGKIITGKGAGASIEFGLKLAEVMTSPEVAAHLRSSLQCR